MAQNVLIGFGVVSQDNNHLATATFDSIAVSSSTFVSPTITSLSATTGPVGTNLSVLGTGFGATQGSSVVTLNGQAVTVTSWSANSIGITIPTGATSGGVEVTVAPQMLSSNSVAFAVTSQPLPSGWLDADVGPVGIAGSATYASGTFTVQATGSYINNSSDSMHFVYRPLIGDGSIGARVASVTGGTNPQPGIMIRESLYDGSIHAFAFVMGSQNDYFYDRDTTNGSTSSQNILGGASPYWIKLVRDGNTFIAYAAPDGINWTQIGSSQTISMAQSVLIGLAASSNNNSSPTTVTFDNVAVVSGTTPILSALSPNIGPLGTQVTLTGSNFGATQGSSTVNFNGTPATSVTSWSDTQIVANVPAGATSGPVTVVVSSVVSNTNLGFLVINPIITSLSPGVGQAGATIGISGSGFGSAQGASQVSRGIRVGDQDSGDRQPFLSKSQGFSSYERVVRSSQSVSS